MEKAREGPPDSTSKPSRPSGARMKRRVSLHRMQPAQKRPGKEQPAESGPEEKRRPAGDKPADKKPAGASSNNSVKRRTQERKPPAAKVKRRRTLSRAKVSKLCIAKPKGERQETKQPQDESSSSLASSSAISSGSSSRSSNGSSSSSSSRGSSGSNRGRGSSDSRTSVCMPDQPLNLRYLDLEAHPLTARDLRKGACAVGLMKGASAPEVFHSSYSAFGKPQCFGRLSRAENKATMAQHAVVCEAHGKCACCRQHCAGASRICLVYDPKQKGSRVIVLCKNCSRGEMRVQYEMGKMGRTLRGLATGAIPICIDSAITSVALKENGPKNGPSGS